MAPTLRSRRENANGNIPPSALRHSPRRLRSAAVKEPHSTQTSKQTSRSAICRTNPRTRPFCYRRCKRGFSSSTNIDSLSDDLLLEILLRVSAEDIHENARVVCWRWKRIVHGADFAYAHLHRTGYNGLLLSWWSGLNPIFMAATHGGGIEVSKLSSNSKYLVKASCNGLVLVTFVNKNNILYILNPITKRRFKLPKFCGEGKGMYGCRCFGIAYAAASRDYKVVTTYRSNCNPSLTKCDVLTVGVDNTWRRHVAAQQLSLESNQLLHDHPFMAEGFMHWASSFGNDVVTLNVETEVFVETPAPLAPAEYRYPGGNYHFLSTGRHLSILISCGDFLWEVWEMKGGSGEWRKVLPNIDLKDHKSKIRQLAFEDDVFIRPVGWVKYPEVLLFFDYTTDSSYIIYNLDNNEINSIKLPPAHITPWKALVHKKSLICIS